MALWKNNLSPIVTQNSLIGMFEMSKSKKNFWLAPLARRESNLNCIYMLSRNVRIYFQTAPPLVYYHNDDYPIYIWIHLFISLFHN